MLFFSLSCSHIKKKHKDQSLLYLQIGNSHLMHGNYPESLDALLKAKKLNPYNPVIQNSLGLAYFVRRKYILAEEHFLNALELNETYTQARINLGQLLLAIGDTDLAIQNLLITQDDLTFNQPEKISFNLGIAYFSKGDYKKAEEQFKFTLLHSSKKNCSTYIYHGRTLLKQGFYEKALESFNLSRVICRKNKREDESLYYTGLCYFHTNQKGKAKQSWKKIMKGSSRNLYTKKAEKMLKLTL